MAALSVRETRFKLSAVLTMESEPMFSVIKNREPEEWMAVRLKLTWGTNTGWV